VTGTFRSLANVNYRFWAAGALVSNIGTWMQRTAQAWLVLTQLTHQNASAVGIVTGLQFAPLVLLLPVSGFAADHFDRRKLLLVTQGTMGALALGLGALTVAGIVQLWHVYLFAFLLGCVTAFDTPARQTFVSELVGEADLSNAVALNSTSFNAARMIGPAIAGLLIASVGTGWAFLINGRDRRDTVATRRSVASQRARDAQPRKYARRLSLRLGAPRIARRFLRAVSRRNVRIQFPSIYRVDGRESVSRRCGSVRSSDVDYGDRNRHRRVARGPARNAARALRLRGSVRVRHRLYACGVRAELSALRRRTRRHRHLGADVLDDGK
jgi:hypothetical protein